MYRELHVLLSPGRWCCSVTLESFTAKIFLCDKQDAVRQAVLYANRSCLNALSGPADGRNIFPVLSMEKCVKYGKI